MSDADEGNPAPSGQESPADEAGAGASVAGAEGMEILDSGPHGEVPGEEGVTGAVGGLGVEAIELGAPEIRIRQEIADVEAAGEGEENSQQGQNAVMVVNQLATAQFHFLFQSLLYRLLRSIEYENHRLIRSRRPTPRVMNRIQVQAQVHSIPRGFEEGATAMAPDGSRDEAVGSVGGSTVPMGSGHGVPIPVESEEGPQPFKPEDHPKAEDEPVQKEKAPEETSKYQSENAEEEARDAERKEEKGESTEKEEGPARNVDTAETKPRNSSLEE